VAQLVAEERERLDERAPAGHDLRAARRQLVEGGVEAVDVEGEHHDDERSP